MWNQELDQLVCGILHRTEQIPRRHAQRDVAESAIQQHPGPGGVQRSRVRLRQIRIVVLSARRLLKRVTVNSVGEQRFEIEDRLAFGHVRVEHEGVFANTYQRQQPLVDLVLQRPRDPSVRL